MNERKLTIILIENVLKIENLVKKQKMQMYLKKTREKLNQRNMIIKFSERHYAIKKH
jgi:hypothetical protein